MLWTRTRRAGHAGAGRRRPVKPGGDHGNHYTDIQVVQRHDGVNYQWCPSRLLRPGLVDPIGARIDRLMPDWNASRHTARYRPKADVRPACLKPGYRGG